MNPIPDWDASGNLPPFVGGPASQQNRSPYSIGLVDLALRFGSTHARKKLLKGLLDYRAALHNAGILRGFQWIDGSFVEDTTQHHSREPNDIDVVTFFELPPGQTEIQLLQANQPIFDLASIKAQFGVDGYPVVLSICNWSYLVRKVTYWQSLWSHDRNFRWKGFLEIDLSNVQDHIAKGILNMDAIEEVGE